MRNEETIVQIARGKRAVTTAVHKRFETNSSFHVKQRTTGKV